MRGTARLAVIGLISAVIVGSPGPASASSDDLGEYGVIGSHDVQVAGDGCSQVPILYSFQAIPSDGRWDLDLTGRGLSAFLYGDWAHSVGGVDHVQWCPTLYGFGVFTLTGTLNIFDGSGDRIEAVPVSFSFTGVRQTTSASIKVSTTKPKAKSSVRVSGCVSSGGNRDLDRKVVVQQRRGNGSWKTANWSYTTTSGCYAMRIKVAAGATYLRAYVPRDDEEERAYSAPVTLKAY